MKDNSKVCLFLVGLLAGEGYIVKSKPHWWYSVCRACASALTYFPKSYFLYFHLNLWAHSLILRAYSCLSSQRLLMTMFGDHMECLVIELWLSTCKKASFSLCYHSGPSKTHRSVNSQLYFSAQIFFLKFTNIHPWKEKAIRNFSLIIEKGKEMKHMCYNEVKTQI